MSLAELTVDNLRCLHRASLSLHPRHNLICGANASGKTSLLEAIFMLGRGRSFRTRNSERLIRHGHERLVVFGKTEGGSPHLVGVQVSRAEGTIAKLDGEYVPTLAELSRAFAVQVIEPGVHRLIEEGAHRRRRWLDWAAFHVEPAFMDDWSRYSRVLKQRNAALRTQAEQASAWDAELVRLGEKLSDVRLSVIERLQPYWVEAVAALLDAPITLSYARGWNRELSLALALDTSRDRDRARGQTHTGPHRADIVLRIDGQPARDRLSRGQQKLAAIAMTLAQLHLLRDTTNPPLTLLLDDPAAELDPDRLTRFAAQVAKLDCQLIVTALGTHSQPFGSPDREFHVEQGVIAPYNVAPSN